MYFISIFSVLVDLKKKDGTLLDENVFSRLIEMLQIFFNEWEQDLCIPISFQEMSDIDVENANENSYLDLILNQAAIYFEHERMFQFLRDGVNPNSRYCGSTLLYAAAVQGTDNVFNPFAPYGVEGSRQRLLTTLKLLLFYGADPLLDNYGKTLMQYLVSASTHVKPYILGVYQDIIRLLTISPLMKPHIAIHPETQRWPIAQVVADANTIMHKHLHLTPYISSIALYTSPFYQIVLSMKDSKHVTIIPKNIKLLTLDEYKQLFEFFNAYPGIDIMPDKSIPQSSSSDDYSSSPSASRSRKQRYFNGLMQRGIVDMIFCEGKLIGFFISDTILCHMNKTPTLIFHAKFALAHMPSTYKGLMKAFIWLRGFALSQQFTKYQHICYNEAASTHGFATVSNVKNFPVYSEENELVPKLVEHIYPSGELTVTQYQGFFYMRDDPMVIHPAASSLSTHPSSSSLVGKVYDAIQSRCPGAHIPMFFKPNAQNFATLRQSFAQIMGPAFDVLVESYTKVVTTENSKSLRARL